MDSICDLWLWVCFVVCCGFVLWCCVGSGRAVFCGAVSFFFFFFSCCGLVVVVAVGAVDVFLSSKIYYFIVVVILFYCDIYIILLC